MGRKHFNKIIWIVGIIMVTFLVNAPKTYSRTVQGVTDDTILIGMETPITGPSALFSKMADSNEAMYLEWGKNINGRSIKLIKLDNGGDPVKGFSAIKKLIFEEKVFLIDGGSISSVILAAKPTIQKVGIPVFVVGVHDAMVNPVTKNIFNPGFAASIAMNTLVDFTMTIPSHKRIAIIHQTNEWGMASYNMLMKFLKEKNITPVIEVITESDAPDLTPQILKLKEANVDVVFAPIYISTTTVFLRDALKLGLDVPILGSTATSVSDQYNSLKSAEPLRKYFSPHWLAYSMDDPKIKMYENLFKKYQPDKKFDAMTLASGNVPLVVMDALKKCGRDLNWEKFINILETQYHNWAPDNFVGATPITFSKTRHLGMDRLNLSTIATGKFEIVKTYQDYEKLLGK